jgi:4-hydroxy-2-oxoheptanedioate aldolase
MRANRVKQLWKDGKASVGSWMNLGSPLCAEIMSHLGFDWIAVDAEHGPWDLETIQHQFVALSTSDTVPMIRVPGNDAAYINRVLDAGAYGVIVPMVNSREDALRAVQACRYPPLGSRSMGFGRADQYAGKDYKAKANEEIALVVQIEHIDAVKHIDEILSVPGIDALFIGPADLAASMGIPVVLGDNPDPRHQEAIRTIIASARTHRIPAGIHVATAEDANRRIREGFQFIALGTDVFFLVGAARAALGQLVREPKAG